MILVFTGNGKGKTTAALGCVMRSLGWGKRVLMIQFVKSAGISGEQEFAKKLKVKSLKFKIISVGKGFVGIGGDKISFSVHKKAAQSALKLTGKAIKSRKWDLIILDEINVAVDLKLTKANDVLKVLLRNSGLGQRGSAPDIILTGRNAPKIFIEKADLVTEMKEVKHPYQKGIIAKRGIDY